MSDDTRPRVFIPRHPYKVNPLTRETQNDGDLSGVLEFGHPIFMLPRENVRFRRTVKWLHAAMFDFTEADYLLAIGEPVVIVAATLIAKSKIGTKPLQTMRWIRRTGEFKVFSVE